MTSWSFGISRRRRLSSGYGHGHRAGDVARLELVGRPHVQNRDVIVAHQASQLLERHWLELVVIVHIQANHVLYVGEPAVAERLERAQETKNVVIRQAIVHVGPIATSLDEARLPKDAEMRARVLDRRRDVLGECFDGLFALAQEVEQLDPFWAGERVPDARELGVEGVLELSVAGHVAGLCRKGS